MRDQELRDQLAEAVLGLLRPEIDRLVAARVAASLPEPSPWLDPEGAAEYLSITVRAVRQRVYDGKLPVHYDSGGKMRFKREELDGTIQ